MSTGLLPTRVDGAAQAQWVLMDYGDVIVHVFTPEMRDFYRLEQLWGEAPARDVRLRRCLNPEPREASGRPASYGS